MRARLAVTLGDPRGIGPEIVGRALADDAVRARCELVLVGPDGTGLTADDAVGRWTPGGDAAAPNGDERLSSSEREELVRLRQENRDLKQERNMLAKAAAWFAGKSEWNSKPSNDS